jgi:hypothetical protein
MAHGYYDSPLIGGLLIVISTAYLLILIGFGIRSAQEGRKVRLLWPWMLMLIFGFCGMSGYASRLAMVSGYQLSDGFVLAEHFTLAALSWTYAIGQLLSAAWPALFEDQPYFPRFSADEGSASSETAEHVPASS